PGATETDGSGDARNIACPHSGSSGYHQRLEGRQPVPLCVGLRHDADGLGKQTELDESCPYREVDAGPEQQDDQNTAVEQIAQCVDKICEHVEFLSFLIFFYQVKVRVSFLMIYYRIPFVQKNPCI